jgi:hypothetical protein
MDGYHDPKRDEPAEKVLRPDAPAVTPRDGEDELEALSKLIEVGPEGELEWRDTEP